MIRQFILPVVVAVLLTSGCSGGKKDWQPLSDETGKFSIELPGKAKQQAFSNGEFTGTAWAVDMKNGAYMIAYVDLPVGTPYDYNVGVNGIAGKYTGTVVSTKDIKIDGTTGKEFEINIKKPAPGHAAGRLFYVGNRLYMLQALGSS